MPSLALSMLHTLYICFLDHSFEKCKSSLESSGNSYNFFDLNKLEDQRYGMCL